MGHIWENRPLIDSETFSGATGSVTKNLPVTGQLSGLIIEPYWTNLAAGDNTLNIFELLSLIEVVHRGSERIKSFNGLQAAGIAWRRGREFPCLQAFGNRSSVQEGRIVIPFGRHLYDPVVGLNLDQLKNPQLKLEWNNAYGTSGDTAGGFHTTIGSFSVRMIFAPDGVTFRNYIKTTKIDDWTIEASATKRVDLPLGHKWPRIYLYHDCSDRAMFYNIAKVTLNVNTGEWKPIVLEARQLEVDDLALFGAPVINRYFTLMNDYAPLDVRSLFDKPWKAWVETQGLSTDIVRNASGITDPTIDLHAPVAIEAKLMDTGIGFGRIYTIPFDVRSIDEAFNSGAPEVGKVELEVEAASAVGTTPKGYVILEELI